MKQKMKKLAIASTMLVLVLLLGVAGWLILGKRKVEQQIQEEINALGIEWYSEDETEFTITTVEQFYEFAKLSTYYDFVGQTVKLGADLVLNEGNAKEWADRTAIPENIWESIYGFGGTFDGQGHTISGVYGMGHLYTVNMYRSEQTDYVTTGLFRNTLKGCVIKNFRLINSFFDSDLNQGAGCVASTGAGTFDSIYVDAYLTSQKNYVGGIVGRATDDITITNCWFDGEINIVGGYARPTGGILAQGAEGKNVTIEHCLMSGEMYNDLYQRGVNMGGIMGTSKKSNVTITDCLVSGNLHNDWQIVGSALGNVPAESVATLSHVYTVEEAWKKTIGHKTGELNGTPVTYEREKLIGYGGYQWTSLDFENYWAVVEDGTPVLKTFAENALSLEGVTRMVDLSWYDDTKDTFEIHDLADLYGFALLSYSYDFEGKTVKLCSDITINTGNASEWAKNAPEYDWISIGSSNLPFKGTFDGQMHTISGVYLKTDKSYNGLFGMTSDSSVVKRFRLTNSYFESSAASFGSVAGRGLGTFDTIYSNAIVRSTKGNIGGLIGQVTGGEKLVLKNCWFDGSVKSMANEKSCIRIGGLVGFLIINAEISNCLNSGTVDASVYTLTNSATSTSIQPYVGGFIGQVHQNGEARITDSMNVGDVLYYEKATSSFGSIIGTASGKGERSTAIFSNVFATKESCKRTATGYVSGQVLTYDEETLKGYGGYRWTTLDFNKYWSVVENDTSVLKSFAKKSPSVSGVARMIDTSWYNEKETNYVLNDVADLYGFAVLSYTNDFAGKTVTLGADIVVNEGNAADWAKSAPENKWMSISSRSLPFAGTFDGQMHTISGLYLMTDKECQGMFSTTAKTAVIKNFSLKNSYFESSAISLASISGRGMGTFDTIYSDAIVVSPKANVAGFVAHVTDGDKITLKNCWFDGTIKCTTSDTTVRRAGGMLGFAVSGAELSNCLNTGTIDGTELEYYRPYIGGMVGHIYKTAEVMITESMCTGLILTAETATSSYGSVIGYAEKKVTVSHVYATSESCAMSTNGSLSGQIIIYDEERLSGYGGYQWTTLDFKNYWAVVLDDTSVLKSFAKSVPSLAGVEPMLDISWYNDKDTKFTLTKEAELFGFALLSTMNNFEGKTIILGDDMNVANEGEAKTWATNAPKYEWLSIGTIEYPFAGTFDGNGKDITGIYLSTEKANGGLFGVTAETAVITDFSLKNSYFESSNESLGSIVGRAGGSFSEIYSDAIVVTDSSNAGGILGRTAGTIQLADCWFAGSVTNKGNSTSDRCTGGIAGRILHDAAITNCLNTGIVDAKAYTVTEKTDGSDDSIRPYVGGLVGFMGNKKALTMTSCLNAGEVRVSEAAKTAKTGCYGSVLGRIDSATTANLYDVYTITDDCDKDVSKHNSAITSLDVHKSTLAEIMGMKALSKMPGLFLTEVKDGEAVSYEMQWQVTAEQAPVPVALATETVVDIDVSWYDQSGTYELEDRADVYGFALLSYKTNFEDEEIKLTKPITINDGKASEWSKENAPEYPWICISQNTAFKGTFNGQNHTIYGVYINESVAQRGLFAKVGADAKIQNFSLKEAFIYSTADHCGSIAGNAAGTFENIYSEARVEGEVAYNRGGLIGRANGGDLTMKNCWMNGTVTSLATDKGGVGGLIGRIHVGSGAEVTITNCLNSKTITSKATTDKNAMVGGLVGYKQSGTLTISHCLNTGEIHYEDGALYYGLIMGRNTSDTIIDTYSTSQEDVQFISGVDKSDYTPAKTKATGSAALVSMSKLFMYKDNGSYKNNWAMTLEGTPILSQFAAVSNTTCKSIDVSWYDEDGDYTLSDAADLYGMVAVSQTTTFENEEIRLGATIDVNDGNFDAENVDGTKAKSYVWPGIGGTTPETRFLGTFNGQMNAIRGLYCYNATNSVGFFREVGIEDGNTCIKNLIIENSYFRGNQRVGSVVGQSLGCTVDTVYSDAVVVGNHQITGGLIGRAQTDLLTIRNCWFAGSVTNNANNHIGGLLGYASTANVNIAYSLNTGAITSSKTNIGGLVGSIASGYELSITNSLNTGTVNATGESVGSILGNQAGTLTAQGVYATSESFASTVAGSTHDGVTACTVAALTGTQALTNAPKLYVPQLVGESYVLYWSVSEYTPVLTSFASYAKGADNQTAVKSEQFDVSWYKSSDTSYELSEESQFYGFALLSKVSEISGFEGKTIKLTETMNLNPNWTASSTAPEHIWPGIGDGTVPFKGNFDGQGNSIKGIYMSNTDAYNQYIGLFRKVDSNGYIKNLRLLNSFFSSKGEYVGAIAGASNADMDSVYTDATVEGYRNFIGGFVGRIDSGADVTITNCCHKGVAQNLDSRTNAAAGKYVGGFVGRNIGTVAFEDCLNAGTVSAPNYKKDTDPRVGGFVGDSTVAVSFTNCLNIGTVSVNKGTSYAAILGKKSAGTSTFSQVYALTGCCNGGADDANSVTFKTSAELKETKLFYSERWMAAQWPILKSYEQLLKVQ